VQTGEDGLDGLVRSKGGGVDGEAGETGVKRVATGETDLGGGGIREDGAGDGWITEVLEHAAVEEGGKGGVEEDGEGAGGLFEEEAVGEVFRGSATKGQDGIGEAEGGGEGGGFEAAETGFAVFAEELGDGGSGAVLDVGVEVEEVPGEAGGEETADGGFAGAHEACEDQTFKVSGDGRSRGLGRLGEGG